MERPVVETPSDRYVISQYLAEGGMGAIYIGKRQGVEGFEKEVVLKQLLPEYTADPKFIELFLREAKITASLEHANIVRTIDLVTADDNYFIVMEYVRGADLRTIIRRVRMRGQLFSPHAAIFVAQSILDALAYAHHRETLDGMPLQLVHRDISPSNILCSADGEVKLTDFGIARASNEQSIYFRVKGKSGYMSPEQARGDRLDHRTDLFSLATVLWELLAGERLFVAEPMAPPSVVYGQPILPPSAKRRELPRELDAVVLRALSLKPEERFASADDFAEALGDVAHRHGLGCSSLELGAHLRQICGDASTWRDGEPVERERHTSMVGEKIEDLPPPLKANVKEGTRLTSILRLAAEPTRPSFRASVLGVPPPPPRLATPRPEEPSLELLATGSPNVLIEFTPEETPLPPHAPALGGSAARSLPPVEHDEFDDEAPTEALRPIVLPPGEHPPIQGSSSDEEPPTAQVSIPPLPLTIAPPSPDDGLTAQVSVPPPVHLKRPSGDLPGSPGLPSVIAEPLLPQVARRATSPGWKWWLTVALLLLLVTAVGVVLGVAFSGEPEVDDRTVPLHPIHRSR